MPIRRSAIPDFVSKRATDLGLHQNSSSRLSGAAESGDSTGDQPRKQGLLGILETGQFPPAVLLKSRARREGLSRYTPGSGEGQNKANTFSVSGFGRSPSRCPITRRGSGRTPSARAGSKPQAKQVHRKPGWTCKVPVRRWAHRPGSVRRLEIESGQRLSPAFS